MHRVDEDDRDCGRCAYWIPIGEDDRGFVGQGSCKRYAPMPRTFFPAELERGGLRAAVVWPITEIGDCCGEFQLADGFELASDNQSNGSA